MCPVHVSRSCVSFMYQLIGVMVRVNKVDIKNHLMTVITIVIVILTTSRLCLRGREQWPYGGADLLMTLTF